MPAAYYVAGMSTLWTLEELDAQIADWKAALLAVSSGRFYTISGQSVSHYSLPEIREQLAYLQRERQLLLAAQSGRPRRPGPLAVRPVIGRG